ncbi:rRNA maturation RNase YbeY [Spirochaeta africana]|uniref:Endoribonuclease YbeY n=1 Tax=Spirochaeta africana (strain ATCC 700263 / DSM 8902 / Z-7692) TaxID=889378 RepID=H9UJK1_SPIAZ|nr:rRNA maturation RNase YbeY [Spirochaeta africana]AFG37694.1 metalloprotein, YbeY/UPF0054 family [Spirochaeta africana DSM 8902]
MENQVEVSCCRIDEPVWIPEVAPLVNRVLTGQGIKNVECSVVLCDNSYIAELNLCYRQLEGPTDVLSFCSDEGEGIPQPEGLHLPHPIGDIVVSLEYVQDNAVRFAVPYEQELRRVIIHGVLHLLGHDHRSNEESEPMLQLQEKLVQAGDILF